MNDEILKKKDGVKDNSNSKKLLTLVIALIVIILIGVGVYFGFLKKDNNQSNKENEVNEQKIAFTIAKTVESPDFNIILDDEGSVYLELKDMEQVFVNENLLNAKKKLPTYVDNSKEYKLFKIANNIEKVEYLHAGNGGGGYILLLDGDNKLYSLNDYEIVNTGDLALMVSDKLNNVTKLYNDCDIDGCMVIAEATVNEKKETIRLYDLFEKENVEKIRIFEPSNYSKTVAIGKKIIDVKLQEKGNNGELYINDNKVATYDYDHIKLYLTNNFAIVTWPGAQGGDLVLGSINEDGEYSDTPNGDTLHPDKPIYVENGKIYGAAWYSDEHDIYAGTNKVEFIYKNKKVEIK